MHTESTLSVSGVGTALNAASTKSVSRTRDMYGALFLASPLKVEISADLSRSFQLPRSRRLSSTTEPATQMDVSVSSMISTTRQRICHRRKQFVLQHALSMAMRGAICVEAITHRFVFLLD